ncbi:MAG TPA: VCBS repeat-containing protein, partial [Chthoniobacteraceae bacterium]|nr:VCBS repeat-containing protein [Chthoniobacteraceae bacterium]
MPRPRARFHSSLEALESRIAPALLITGANLLGGGGPSTGETSAGGNSATVVKILSGTAIVWYQDYFGPNSTEVPHIVGISVGPNTSLEVHGDILGDIVANLTASGRLSDSDNDPLNGEDGAILLPNNILGIKTFPLSGEKGGLQNIITAGSVTNVKVQGTLNGIYAGDGVFDDASHLLVNGKVTSSLYGGGTNPIDFNPIEPGTQPSFVFTKTLAEKIDTKLTGMQPGASISNVSVGKAVELQVFAGSGNPNELANAKTIAGGSVRYVTIESAFSNSNGLNVLAAPSYELHAGVGSSGATGGAGGAIDHITEKTSTSKVVVIAGKGGSGATGPGGAGGSITFFDAGSDSSRYFLTAGDGGPGIPGGNGGSIVNNNFSNRSPIGGLLVTGNFDDKTDTDNIDEVIVINQGTGEMIVEKNTTGDGSHFAPITQHLTGPLNMDPVTVIPTLGNTPISAYAADVNNDGHLDLVVAYKNSNSIGVFLGQGDGTFWNPTLDSNAGAFDTINVPVQFSPAKITPSNGRIVVAENLLDGTSALHLLSKTLDTMGVLTFTSENGFNALTKPITDIVTVGDGSVIVGTSDGGLRRATVSGLASGKPFDVSATPIQTVTGGILDLDVDEDGGRVVALSATGNAFYTYDYSGAVATSILTPVSVTSGLAGKPLVVKFVSDGIPSTDDQVAVLEGLATNSRVDLYSPTTAAEVTTFSLSKTVGESSPLKNFVPVYGMNGEAGFAAVSGSLSQFTFSDGFIGGVDYALPFASKLVQATAGTGGDGIDYQPPTGALKSGKGGAGGSVLSFNAEANEMIITAGNGGQAVTNAGGAGGSIFNPTITSTVTANPVQLFLHADQLLSLKAGDGGAPSSPGKASAAGGAGGSLGNLNIEIGAGDLVLTSGLGGDSRGGTAGAGGNISGITSLLHQGNLTVLAGHGGEALLGAVPATGSATSGVGGAGGAVKSFKHELRLEPDLENFENPYFVKIEAGYGGASKTAAGGAGGVITGVTLKLDEPNMTFDSGVDLNGDHIDDAPGAHTDSTLTTTLTAGYGGAGATGGIGGLISGLKFDVVLDQQTAKGFDVIGPAVLGLTAGYGGQGTNGAGGNGGSILFSSPISGLTGLDNDNTSMDGGPTEGLGLLVQAGYGGNGTTKGGNGGDISGLTAQNEAFVTGEVITTTQLSSAVLVAGHGGNGDLSDGGRGGSVTNSLLGVQGGFLFVQAGYGGEGGKMGNATTAKLAKGGNGGAVTGGEFGLVSTGFSVGMQVYGGTGGDGWALGGTGGAIGGLKLNSSQSTSSLSAMLVAGAGGAAKLATAVGGKGGDVSGVSQVKDINSSINLIQAGNGGDNLVGKAGAGGNVSAIKTSGFIGRPSDGVNGLGVIDHVGMSTTAQGVFSGRGGTGASAALHGVNGSVTGVTARQIAAIAAAMDSATGLFAAAS